MNPAPPKYFLRFFRWFCHPKLLKYIEGDLMELYHERLQASGKRRADVKFIIDVLLLIRPGIIKPTKVYETLNDDMFRNYFKVGIRNILKHKVFSFINVFGLAIAMSVCMLIILMLSDQHRYDAFHKKKDRIYRILSDAEDIRQPYATTPFPLSRTLSSEYPIVEESTSLTPGVGGDAFYGDDVVEMRGYFADPSFFSVFSFELEDGDKRTALTNPNSMVISRALATRLFDGQNPIGKSIEFSDRELPFPIDYDGKGSLPVPWGSFTITGVINEARYKSHLKFDMLVSVSTRQLLLSERKVEDLSDNWDWFYRTYTYVILKEDRTEEDLTLALKDIAMRKYANRKEGQVKNLQFRPQKLRDVQLGLSGNDTNSRLPLIGYYFLSLLAIVIMISACLNYTNLSIARALTRAKEIGIRKVTGALRKNLIIQFLSESILTALLALAMAIVFLLFITPAFKGLWVNQYLNFELPSSISVYLLFVGFATLIGIVAGLYPAFYLSGYQPAKALKNLSNMSPGKLGMRKALGVSQFVISLFFITTSVLIYNQFKHFLSFDYGFQTQNIVNVELQGVDYQRLSNETSSVQGVAMISASDIIPSTGTNNNNEVRREGGAEEYAKAGILLVDENFTANLGIELIAGKGLPRAGTNSDRFILVNESTVAKFGYSSPADIVGAVLDPKWGDDLLEVIGVVKNFHYRMLINEPGIGPLIMRNQPEHFEYLNIRLNTNDIVTTISNLEKKWKSVDPIHPFKYEFFDEALASTHQAIFDIVSILGFIAFLAIVIACLGLWGMAIYTAERRTKEVGIRKVLGAAEFSIALLLSREFIKVLAWAIIIGAPFSYLVNNLWLQKFPNRVEFGLGTVLFGVFVLLLLGLLTIGSQTIKASRNNPVVSLKSE